MASRRGGSLRIVSAGILALLDAASIPPPAAAGPSFTGIGFLPNFCTFSAANAVSADGAVVGGTGCYYGYNAPVRWTSQGGLVALGYVYPSYDIEGDFTKTADVTSDGALAVGVFDTEAFRWTAAGMTFLGHLPPLGPTEVGATSQAVAVSGDGSRIAGFTRHFLGCPPPGPWHQPYCGTSDEGFLWTPGGGLTSFAHGAPTGISEAGDVIVGNGTSGGFRFSSVDGLFVIPPPPAGGGIFAIAVSSDGAIVVGNGRSDLTSVDVEAVRWSAVTGTQALGVLPGSGVRFSQPFGVSGDGRVVVGTSGRVDLGVYPFEERAFIWDEAHGMRDLAQVLTNELGLDLTGWTLNRAADISADGTVVVGSGRHPDGSQEGFVAVIPEPSMPTLLASGLALLVLLGRRRARAFGGSVDSRVLR